MNDMTKSMLAAFGQTRTKPFWFDCSNCIL